jgi:hypothetical protein
VAGFTDDALSGPVTQYNSVGYVEAVLIRTYPYWDHAYGGTPDPLWPAFSSGGFVPWYATLATNQASGTGRSVEGWLEIQFEGNVNFP